MNLTKSTAKEEVDDMRNEAFKDRKALTIAVEGKDDVAFWSFVFDRSPLKGKYKIYKSYNYPKPKASGKNTLIHFRPYTQRDFAICIDSDFDYLLQNTDWQSSFVFQTYTDSIENYCCYVPSLQKVINRAANLPSDTEGVNFEDIFIRQFSKVIYELTVESLLIAQNTGRVNEVRGQLGEVIKLTSGQTVEAMLSDLVMRIQSKIQNLIITDEFRQQLTEKGLTPETAYLFARGHDVLNSVFLPILKLIQKEIKENKLSELKTILHTKQRESSEKAYRMGITNVQTCLLENRDFTDCFLFQKIENDIKAAFN